jgi:diaminopimelate decarboxylase
MQKLAEKVALQTTDRAGQGFVFPEFKRHFSEFIGIGKSGHLEIEGRDCAELAKTFGTPLYVLSENQFRLNYRRFRDAFASRYPKVEILFANKSNRSLAIRHIMNQEGAGGDCFGVNELYLALAAGTDPRTLVLNGSNKDLEEIEMAVRSGVCINIDAMDELDIVDEVTRRLGCEIEVGIRVKLELNPLEKRVGVVMHGPGSLAEQARAHKWGMTLPQTIELVNRIRGSMPQLHLNELHYHLSRMDNKVADFAVMTREMVQWSRAVYDATGWRAACLDIGGGWAFGRPEKTGPYGADDETAPTFDDYAEAVCSALKDECARLDMPLPTLRIEPGWAIISSAGVAIGRVGATKEWPGFKKWVNVDLSTNHIPPPWYHHIVAVEKADHPGAEVVDIVGPLCSADVLGAARQLPKLVRGDHVALLDIGGYAESHSKNMNAQLRPATVLVAGDSAEVTTERERLSDVIGRYRVPARLLGQSVRAKATTPSAN